MPLANISVMPRNDAQATSFDFSHYQDHQEIVAAIFAHLHLQLPLMPLYPAAEMAPEWQRMHQSMHDAMNRALNLPQGRDFTNAEINSDWYNANWREHAAARAKLGI